MVDKDMKISLVIENITIDEAKKVMELVREFEKKDTERVIFTKIKGLEEINMAEASKILKEIFPGKKTAG